VFLSCEIWNVREGEPVPLAFWICLGLSVVLGVVIYLTTKPDQPPKWSPLFSIIALVICIIWIEFLSGILVDLIGLLGILLNVNTAYLGATLLAWGNSIGDFVANVGISK